VTLEEIENSGSEERSSEARQRKTLDLRFISLFENWNSDLGGGGVKRIESLSIGKEAFRMSRLFICQRML
jgi:hypothetical protein